MNKLNYKEIKKIFVELKSGNKDTAIEKLYSKYRNLVYGIAFSILKNKEESEEVVQTVFLKLYTIKETKLPNCNECSWLYKVTKNETISNLRKKKNNVNLDDIYNIYDSQNYINEIIDKNTYNKLLKKLDEDEQEIISLKIFSNLTFSQIGKLLNKSSNTIKWKYYKAIKTLNILITNLVISLLTFILLVKKFTKNKKYEEQKEKDITLDNNNMLGKENTSPNIEIHSTTGYSYTQLVYNVSVFTIFIFSSMFTIIFTFFFIKYQLKLKRKRLNIDKNNET